MTHIEHYIQRLMGMSRTEPGDALVIDPYSIGDVFQTLSLMDSFRRVHGIRRINLMCCRRVARVISLFRNIDGIFLADAFDGEKLALLAQTRWYAQQKTVFVAPPGMHIDDVTRKDEGASWHIMAFKKAILGLPYDSQPVLPPIHDAVVHAAHVSAMRQGVRPDSVIIFNHAQTMLPMDPEVYRPLLEVFPQGVFFDGWSGAPSNWGRRLDIPLEQVPYFCDLAGHVICIRSGITELLSLSSANIYTIYPGGQWMARHFKNKDTTAEMFRNWGIRDLGLNPTSHEKKLLIENGDSVSTISGKILDSIRDRY